jgi:hypothetical protein
MPFYGIIKRNAAASHIAGVVKIVETPTGSTYYAI